jgi:hypothetical protein
MVVKKEGPKLPKSKIIEKQVEEKELKNEVKKIPLEVASVVALSD